MSKKYLMGKFNLKEISTKAPKELNKQEVKDKTTGILKELNELQNVLYAQHKHCILVILQGMDASGKDGAIRHVFGTLNPMGVMVKSYKAPTAEELDHDFLWRIHSNAPAKGMIQIFNRSQYEDIIITRVHKWINDGVAKKRMKAINEFETLLQEHNNTHILKFYLHVSREEQQERLMERTNDPKKHWKYNEADFKEVAFWDDYMEMYEDCFENCNEIPWTIVPADQNWFKEYLIASTVCNLLKSLKLEFPSLKTNKDKLS
jgi:PPK2 family polyphosphate:nucleotide phosphotransferase